MAQLEDSSSAEVTMIFLYDNGETREYVFKDIAQSELNFIKQRIIAYNQDVPAVAKSLFIAPNFDEYEDEGSRGNFVKISDAKLSIIEKIDVF